MKRLNEVELEMITGGILPIIPLGPTYKKEKNDEPRVGGVTYTW